jgi:hypothetical protein
MRGAVRALVRDGVSRMALLARDGATPRLRNGERILYHQFARMRVSEERVSRGQFRTALVAAEYRDA